MKKQGLSSELIARVLGVVPKWTIADLENKFPPRDLATPPVGKADTHPEPTTQKSIFAGIPGCGGGQGAMVTRFAPSPTGYMHIGGLYQALLDWKLANQSGGVFYLRIEDTDTKREVADAVKIIKDSLREFGLAYNNVPEYGPYNQSERRDIYHAVVADLLARGLAYPCFLSAADMDEIREKQKAAGWPTGIYGEFARDRDLGESEIIKQLDAGLVPSIRLYSTGDPSRRIFCKDAVRGSISFPENNEDIVLIKSNDGLPTYHFAHLCDDHFMRTTHVVRGEEWLSSFPLHIQMFNMMSWTPPAYIHTSTIDKIDSDTGKQRKLSKRKDPEANVAHFMADGWPVPAVLNYLFNIMASGYEEAKAKNPDMAIADYELRIKKIPTSGALFDWKKLEWWAREFIAKMSVGTLAHSVTQWAKEYDTEWDSRLRGNDKYLLNILSIERDDIKRVRKDFVTWKQTLQEVEYFWDDKFVVNNEFDFNKNTLCAFIRGFAVSDDRETWWNKIVKIAGDLGLKNGDVAMNLRVAITGRTNTPDLYSIIQVMGAQMVIKRVENVINKKD